MDRKVILILMLIVVLHCANINAWTRRRRRWVWYDNKINSFDQNEILPDESDHENKMKTLIMEQLAEDM
uniref:Uncharacterized LOC101243034 n=1 Tax=Ciona intestinalis TaxID=7719 RepID=F6SEP3_CIOIN